MKIIAGMATTPSRYRSAEIAAQSLFHQVSEVILFENEADGDMPGDGGKFKRMFDMQPDEDFIFLSVDDDIIYPPDYAETMKAAVISQPNAIHSCHGRIFQRFPVRSYYREGLKYHCLHDVAYFGKLHAAGTGVMAFRSSLLYPLTWSDFPTAFMADIWMAKIARERGIELRMVPHKAGWLKLTQAVPEEATIWSKYNRSDSFQTRIINQVYAH